MKVFLVSFLLFLSFDLLAQSDKKNLAGINGNIVTADGQPAPNISVLIKSLSRGTMTDEKGNFEIGKIPAGIYDLHISLAGSIDSSITIEIKRNIPLSLHLQLKQTYAALKTIIIAAKRPFDYVGANTSEFTKLNLPLIEIPQNIEVTSHQLLADEGLLFMSEALRTTSGVTKFAGGINDYNPLIRGTDATWAQFRNGVGGYWWNQQEDVSMLEKIEFIKGPAAFMISVAQPGGIINNLTKQPTKERIATISEGYGSYNMMRLPQILAVRLTKKKKSPIASIWVRTSRKEHLNSVGLKGILSVLR